MEHVIKQLKQFKTDAIYEKRKNIIMLQIESADVINGYLSLRLF